MSTSKTVSSPEHLLVRRLRRKGPYQIKSSSVGWWVDGACGYMVAGYYDTKAEAVEKALANIEAAKQSGQTPIWFFW